MAYPGQFYRLVLIGKIYTEDFNTSLSFVPTSGNTVPAVTPELVADIAVELDNMWRRDSVTEEGLSITSSAVLDSFKLNRIGADGRYTDEPTPPHVFAGGVPAPGQGGQPAQIATVLTIRGSDESGLAGKGRMYWPATSATGVLGTDGRIAQGNALDLAEYFSEFLDRLDALFIDNGTGALAGIASKTRTGAFQERLYVSAGRVPDTMRSRRTSLPEDPQHWPEIFN